MPTTNLMSGTLEAIISSGLAEASKYDLALQNAMKKKDANDCVNAIYSAFYEMASKQGNCALSGSDDLIISAAIHWYTENDVTTESIVNILKNGTSVHGMKKTSQQPVQATTKGQSTQASKKAKKTPSHSKKVEENDDWDWDM